MFEFIADHCFQLELPAIEHHKLWTFQTVCWLPGERSLPIGLLVEFLQNEARYYRGNNLRHSVGVVNT